VLFQRFDRLLFLASGGRTVYFGPIGEESSILTSYLEKHGASPCPAEANPAEWILEVIGAAPGSHSDIDWPEVWRNSHEIAEVHAELEELKIKRAQTVPPSATKEDKASFREFAASFPTQLIEVHKRVAKQYWRTPSYVYSKLGLCAATVSYIPALVCQFGLIFPGTLCRIFLLQCP